MRNKGGTKGDCKENKAKERKKIGIWNHVFNRKLNVS